VTNDKKPRITNDVRMTQIDFYVLPQDTLMARIHFMCRLVEKAVTRQHQVTLALDSEEQAASISDYLWSFKPESFLAHATQTAPHGAPVVLSWDTSDKSHEQHHDIMINLSQRIPNAFSQYQRVMEVVTQEENCLAKTRQHFQFYKDRGYPLKSHTISPT